MGCVQAGTADVKWGSELRRVRASEVAPCRRPCCGDEDDRGCSLEFSERDRGARGAPPSISKPRGSRLQRKFPSWASTISGGSFASFSGYPSSSTSGDPQWPSQTSTGSSSQSASLSNQDAIDDSKAAPKKLYDRVAIDDSTAIPKDLYESLLLAAREMEDRSGRHLEHLDKRGRQRLVRADLSTATPASKKSNPATQAGPPQERTLHRTKQLHAPCASGEDPGSPGSLCFV